MASEIIIRPLTAMSALAELHILGRELHAATGPIVVIDPPLEEHTLGGNTTLRGHTFELAAEVIHLSRTVLITGDHGDFDETHVGLHVMGGYGGEMRVSYTRIEWCGQSAAPPPLGTGVMGRYCLHMHHLSHCPKCYLEGNAIEHGIEKGVVVHDTHDARIHRNVVWNLLGASFYVEDGNEINNTLSENVALCADMRLDFTSGHLQGTRPHGSECKMDGGGHIHGVGFYVIGMNNRFLDNRAAGFETGIYTNGGSTGQGPAAGLSCPIHTRFERFERNVMHDCRRWGVRRWLPIPGPAAPAICC